MSLISVFISNKCNGPGTPFNSAAFASPHPLPLRRSEMSSSERDFMLRVSWPEYFEWCLSEDKVVEKLHKKIKIKEVADRDPHIGFQNKICRKQGRFSLTPD